MKPGAKKHGAMNLQSSQILLPWLLLLWPTAASAHVLGDQAGGFVSGFEHPISGLDHIVAMVSVGLWGAQLGAPAIWLLPVTFPIVMAFGGMLGLMGVPLPGTEIGIALSAIALGAMVATERAANAALESPPSWSAFSRSSMVPRTGPSFRPMKAGCSTAWDS